MAGSLSSRYDQPGIPGHFEIHQTELLHDHGRKWNEEFQEKLPLLSENSKHLLWAVRLEVYENLRVSFKQTALEKCAVTLDKLNNSGTINIQPAESNGKFYSVNAKKIKRSRARLKNIGHYGRSSLITSSHSLPQNSQSDSGHLQRNPSPQSSQASGSEPPLQIHNGCISQMNHLRSEPSTASLDPDIELTDMTARDEQQPPPDGEIGICMTQSIGEARHRSGFALPLCGIAIFLGPVNILLGMTANHGDNWKLAFVGSFISWLVVGTTWLFLDIRLLQGSAFTKRCLWHLGGCVASLSFFMWISHVTSDNLPQWLPTIIDCGVGTSILFQNIPSDARQQVGEAITSAIGGIFGGTQVIVRRDEEQLLPEDQRSSIRRRRADIEEGVAS